MSKKSRKGTLLLVGDAVAPTGYSRVLRSIFEPMAGDFEIHHLATRYQEEPHDYPWQLYPASRYGNVYGYDYLPELVERICPATVVVLYDLVYQRDYVNILRQTSVNPNIVIYSPVESSPVEPLLIQDLSGVSRYVVYTDYARRQVEKAVAENKQGNPSFSFPPVTVIPHGVDTDIFHPLADEGESARRAARRHLGLDGDGFRDGGEEDFIVLNGNRNLPKKRMDLTVQGFARFARDKPPGVQLYLHTTLEGHGWNVVLLARRYGILDRLILTTAEERGPRVSNQELNQIYNACDVGLNTSTNEGWGLVSFEHGATRRAQVVPGHSCLLELWEGAAELVDPVLTTTNLEEYSDAFLVSPEGVAAALQRLYEDLNHRNRLAQAAFELANRPEYRWEHISARWRELLDEVEGR